MLPNKHEKVKREREKKKLITNILDVESFRRQNRCENKQKNNFNYNFDSYLKNIPNGKFNILVLKRELSSECREMDGYSKKKNEHKQQKLKFSALNK